AVDGAKGAFVALAKAPHVPRRPLPGRHRVAALREGITAAAGARVARRRGLEGQRLGYELMFARSTAIGIAIAEGAVLVADVGFAAEVPQAFFKWSQQLRQTIPIDRLVALGIEPLGLAGSDIAPGAELEPGVNRDHGVRVKASASDQCIRAHQGVAEKTRISPLRGRLDGAWFLGVGHVSEDQ